MTGTQLLGWIILSLPFIAIFYLVVKDLGWKCVAIILGSSASILSCLYGGMYLVKGGF